MNRIIRLPNKNLSLSGNSYGIIAPVEWLAQYGLKIGSPVFRILTLDGKLRFHLVKIPWSTRGAVRRINNIGWLAIGKLNVKKMKLVKGAPLIVQVDTATKVLTIEKGASA